MPTSTLLPAPTGSNKGWAGSAGSSGSSGLAGPADAGSTGLGFDVGAGAGAGAGSGAGRADSSGGGGGGPSASFESCALVGSAAKKNQAVSATRGMLPKRKRRAMPIATGMVCAGGIRFAIMNVARVPGLDKPPIIVPPRWNSRKKPRTYPLRPACTCSRTRWARFCTSAKRARCARGCVPIFSNPVG